MILMEKVRTRVARVLGSRQFYWAVIIFFVLEAVWVAFSARYPMAFDEDFHLGVIRIYSHQFLPFLSGQPDGANAYGALAADPSYLYHYLMSFPYRAVAFLTDSQYVQVMVLRLINIGIITAGVLLFRKVLLRTGTSPLLVSVATLLFALIPTVPLLAGQINYDSLFLLALAWVCWLVLTITDDLQRKTLDLKRFVILAVSLMLACLVKYAFLPIAVAVTVYLLVVLWRTFRREQFGKVLSRACAKLSTRVQIGLVVLAAVSAGLFLQRYGANLVRYHDPVPSCDAVIGVDACAEYGPWARDYALTAVKPAVRPEPLAYAWQWLQGMHYRMFFMVSGPPLFVNYPPSPLPSGVAVVVLIFGAASLVFYWRQVFGGRPFLVFLLFMAATYAVVLWLQNYSSYLSTGQPVSINGRYFLPLLLPMVAVVGRGLSVATRRWPHVRAWAAVLVIICFLQGGGIFGFILRSDPSWYWPSPAITNLNQAARDVLAPLMLEGPKYYN
ncbi:MAG TPA: hypothetical protein VL737_01320 [Candidatus Pristimantibacillus sp.]|nr:hypothetical protein [Candidatus Pristimantibacillus sp.]